MPSMILPVLSQSEIIRPRSLASVARAAISTYEVGFALRSHWVSGCPSGPPDRRRSPVGRPLRTCRCLGVSVYPWSWACHGAPSTATSTTVLPKTTRPSAINRRAQVAPHHKAQYGVAANALCHREQVRPQHTVEHGPLFRSRQVVAHLGVGLDGHRIRNRPNPPHLATGH